MSFFINLYGKTKISDFIIRKVLDAILINHMKKHDENNEVYVIQARGNSGFFSMWFYAIGHMMYAKKWGGV